MYDLTRFKLREMTACGTALREAASGSRSMEEAANRMVRHLYDGLRSGSDRAMVLVRFYKTHSYGDLGPELQAFADHALRDVAITPATKCLTLLATAGDEPAWNGRTHSRGHQAIPLASAAVVDQLPMVAQLVRQFGMDIADVVQPNPALLVEHDQKTFNVFHVVEALGSPHIPAQDEFIKPYGVRSAFGFGGLLPAGDLFAVILFSRVPVDRDTATMFQTVALSAKLGVLPFANGPIFTPSASPSAA